MALPLPRVVADVGPGGGLVTAMGGINALNNALKTTRFNKVKADYAPLTVPAQAYSQLAYANAVAPQILAKLMGNEGALANMSEEQKRNMLNAIQSAGFKSNNGLNLLSQNQAPGLPSGVGQPSTNALSGWFANKLKGAFGQQPQQGGGNPLTNPMPEQQFAPTQAPQGQEPKVGDAVYGDGINPEIDQAYDEWLKSPEGQAEVAKGESANMPDEQEVLQWKRNKDGQVNAMKMTLTKPMGKQPTYAEKTGAYKGVVEEGQESGKIRAKDIEQLNNSVFNAETNQATLDEVSDILASPTFEKIRQTPLAGHHELQYYAKEGTPEEQQMVGKYYTLTGNLIKDASRDFAGQFRKGEQQLLNGMKPGPSDTVDSAKGKTETLSVLNKMLAARSRLTSKLMSQYHINKLDALEEADRQVNGQEIRKQVHDRLNPTVTIKNRKTGETKTISVAEARKLGVPNV